METSVGCVMPDPVETAPGRPVQIEILEWGKYCETPDGAVLNHAEHGTLGVTANFPQLLRRLCQPEDMSVSKGQSEEEAQRLFEKVSWGTALRPVLIEGKVTPVLYRAGVRSEGGTVLARRRKYSLARYLIDPTNLASPLMLFKAMAPLAGLTKAQAASLDPIRMTASGFSPEELSPEPFLKMALTYIVSGVPVRVRTGETEFFRLVEQLWQALPANLRPLLSAGWNVTASVAPEFAMFSSSGPVEHCGVYSANGWSHVQAISNKLATGKIYSTLLFSPAEDDVQSLIEHYLNTPEMPLRSSHPALSLTPRFDDAAVRSRFVSAGMSILEDGAVSRVRNWLEKGNAEPLERLEWLVKRTYTRSELKELILEGLGNPETRPRADHVAWAFLSGKNLLYSVNEISDRRGACRGALLQAVARQDAHLTLKSLLAAIVAHEADDLPSNIASQLQYLLSATFDQLKLHTDLLRETAAENIYADWAREHAVDLALRLASADMTPADTALEKLQELCYHTGSAAILAAIRKLRQGRQITLDDQAALSRMTPPQIERFCGLLETIWKQAENRGIEPDVLLDWCVGLPGMQYSNPALVLASGGTPTHAQIVTLVKQGAAVPKQLLSKLSEAALHAFYEIKLSIREDPSSWEPIVALWPPGIAMTLLGALCHDLPVSFETPKIKLAKPFCPSAELIQDRIEYWLLGESATRLLLDAAPVLWEWTAALPEPEGNPLLAVDICWCLAQGRFTRKTKLAETPYDEANLAVTLARFSGRYKELSNAALPLWKSAAQGWQLKLLLELFPTIEFSPTPAQLSALVGCRTWLRSHLDRHNIAVGRRAAFKIATAGVQTVQYPGREAEKWLEEWQGSVLAAAYRGIPTPQPALQEIFRAYASTHAERAQICLRYLTSTVTEKAFMEMLSRTAQEFLFPAAMKGSLSADQLKKIVRIVADPGSKNRIQIVADSHCEPFEQRNTGRIAVADYIVALLWHIADRGHSPTLLKHIEKNYAGFLKSQRF